MLSEAVKQSIEQRFQKKVSKPEDCFELAVHIITLTKHPFTAERLKQLWGFYPSDTRISTEEFDTLAKYMGYYDWSQVPAEVHGEVSSDNHYHVEKKLWRNRYLLVSFLKSWGILLLGAIILLIYFASR